MARVCGVGPCRAEKLSLYTSRLCLRGHCSPHTSIISLLELLNLADCAFRRCFHPRESFHDRRDDMLEAETSLGNCSLALLLRLSRPRRHINACHFATFRERYTSTQWLPRSTCSCWASSKTKRWHSSHCKQQMRRSSVARDRNTGWDRPWSRRLPPRAGHEHEPVSGRGLDGEGLGEDELQL